jgi:hypothetical protein
MVRGEANHKVCAYLEVPSLCGLNPWGLVKGLEGVPSLLGEITGSQAKLTAWELFQGRG